MADLIQKQDTLNEGREKINAAIMDAEQAKITSVEADDKATQALANSESTQTQLDTIVINGDSSVEAAQARVDEKGVGHTTLKDRIDDGFTKVTSQLNETNSQLTQNEVNPDDFEGTDFEKVQLAIDEAITTRKSIVFKRLFNITGNTLKINRTGRVPVVFTSINNGGLLKTDSGFMFDTTEQFVSDLFFNNIYFQSNRNAGLRIINGDKFIVCEFSKCKFRNVDTFIWCSDDRFIQSIRVNECQLVGGNGSFIDIIGAYDTVFDNCYFENHENIFNQRDRTVTNAHSKLYNVRFNNCLFQGNVGKSMIINNVESLQIDGCYFEGEVEGCITFRKASGITLGTLNISNCRQGGSSNHALIEWGLNVGNTVTSINNFAQTKPVHDFSKTTAGAILSINDNSPHEDINYKDCIRYITNRKYIKGAENNNIGTQWGNIRKLFKTTDYVSFQPNEQKFVEVVFEEDLNRDGVFSVSLLPRALIRSNFKINYFYRDFNNHNKLLVNVTSENETIEDLSLSVSVLNMFPSL